MFKSSDSNKLFNSVVNCLVQLMTPDIRMHDAFMKNLEFGVRLCLIIVRGRNDEKERIALGCRTNNLYLPRRRT